MGLIYEPKGRAAEYALLALNIYDGCVHGCEYCYVPAIRRVVPAMFHSLARPRSDSFLDDLRKEAPKYSGTDKRVLLCFSCDPYQSVAFETELTHRTIKILREFDIPFAVLTKAGLSAAGDFPLYGENDIFGATLTYLTDGKALKVEPNAPMPWSRIQSLKQAHEKGIETFVSLEPVLDVEETLAIIKAMHEFVDVFRIGKLNHKENDKEWCDKFNVKPIDWRQFGKQAVELCKSLGAKYYIKSELAQYLKGIEFINTDRRVVKKLGSQRTMGMR